MLLFFKWRKSNHWKAFKLTFIFETWKFVFIKAFFVRNPLKLSNKIASAENINKIFFSVNFTYKYIIFTREVRALKSSKKKHFVEITSNGNTKWYWKINDKNYWGTFCKCLIEEINGQNFTQTPIVIMQPGLYQPNPFGIESQSATWYLMILYVELNSYFIYIFLSSPSCKANVLTNIQKKHGAATQRVCCGKHS